MNKARKKVSTTVPITAVGVAIFVDGMPSDKSCVAASCVHSIKTALLEESSSSQEHPICVKQVTTQQIESEDGLRNVHALVFPGGLEQKIKLAMSLPAIKRIQSWRHETGGGLVGICAGAVFLCAQGRRGRGLVQGVELVQDEKFYQADLKGLVTIEPTQDAPSAVRQCLTATQGEEASRMLYVCGPVFRVKPNKKRVPVDAGVRVATWANYASDLAKEEFSRIQQEKQKTPEDSSNSWICNVCLHAYSKKAKKVCCGVTQKEQTRQLKIVSSLVGAMPKSAAVVSVEEDCNGTGDDDMVTRTVLFGPHPECGGHFLLRQAVLGVAEPAMRRHQAQQSDT